MQLGSEGVGVPPGLSQRPVYFLSQPRVFFSLPPLHHFLYWLTSGDHSSCRAGSGGVGWQMETSLCPQALL